jgi:HSP20 family protein
MNIVTYKPLTKSLFDGDFNSVLDNFLDGSFWDFEKYYPSIDVREEKDHYTLEADLPGLTEKDIEVKVENNILSVSSLKKEEKEETKNGYIVRERKSASFARSFVLPEDVNKDAINAEFKNGVLTLYLGKNPQAQPKKIEVKGA